MYGGQCAGMFARSVADLTALCTHYGVPLQLYFLFNESLITRARNYCCDEFMRNDAQHLLFIDSDIGFNPQDVLAMLALQGPDTPYDIIAGPYPKKCISWEKVKTAVDKGFGDKNPNDLEKYVGDYVFNPKSGSTSIPITEPVEVLEAGTGFMMIRKKTMEIFRDSHPELLYRPDHVRTEHFDGSRQIMQYFQAEIDNTNILPIFQKLVSALKAEPDPEKQRKLVEDAEAAAAINKSNRYLSEDYWFCQKIQELGLKTWFCPWIKLQHVGTYVFAGSLADLAAVGAAATADAGQLQKAKDWEKSQRLGITPQIEGTVNKPSPIPQLPAAEIPQLPTPSNDNASTADSEVVDKVVDAA